MDYLEHILPKVGERIGAYEVTGELGRGGFGVVFRARQSGLEADVAIKIMIPPVSSRTDQAQLYERFAQEARIIKELGHPAAIKVRDFGRTSGGLPYLVTEFVPGRTLDRLLNEDGPLPLPRIARIAKQVLGCLAEAHHQGIVHRDLKPANIMIRDIFGEADSVKVLDFGIAKMLHSAGGVRTETGQRFGTPQYMAPEQVRSSKEQDGRVDLYAFGLILAECLTGRPVVEADSVGALLCHARPEPHEFEPAVQASPLFAVIRIATQKEPKDRYLDALAMRRAVERIDSPAVPPTLDETPKKPETPQRPARRTEPEPPGTGPRRRTPDHTPVLPPLAVVERRRRRLLRTALGVVIVSALAVGAAVIAEQMRGRGADPAAEPTAADADAAIEERERPAESGDAELPARGVPDAAVGAAEGSDPGPRVQRRLVVLLPDNDLFNGPEGHPHRPDASELRRGLVGALAPIPRGLDLTIELAVYNERIDWLPEYGPAETDELERALFRTRYTAPVGTLTENPWTALDSAIPRLRVPRPTGGEPSTVLIVVTSALTDVAEPAALDAEVARLRVRLSEHQMTHVLTGVLVYSPTFTEDILLDPTRAPMRVARGLTPLGGWYAVVGDSAEMKPVLRAMIAQLLAMLDLLPVPTERPEALVHAGFESEDGVGAQLLDLAASLSPQALLAQAEVEMGAAHWDTAVQLLRAIPPDAPERVTAEPLIAVARAERRNQDVYDGLLSAEAEGRFSDALSSLAEIPIASFYTVRLREDGVADRIAGAWIAESVAMSQRALDRGDVEQARAAMLPMAQRFPKEARIVQQWATIAAASHAEGSGH